MPPGRAQGTQGVGFVDGVQDHIGVAYRFGEIGCAIVDHFVDAEAAEEVVVGRARGADDVCAACSGDLYREVVDAAGGRVDQNPLARLHIRGVDQGLPGGESSQGDGGGSNVIEVVRFAGEGAGGTGDIFGGRAVAVRVGEHAEDLVAGVEQGDPRADGRDLTGDIPAQHERRRGEEHARQGAVLPVGGVEGGGADPYQDLARAGGRHGLLDLVQHLRATENVLVDGPHGLRNRDVVLAHADQIAA